MKIDPGSMIILSVGGSIVAPDRVDTDFVSRFHTELSTYLAENENRNCILIIGGGGAARHYQQAYREITGEADSGTLDWLGIMATRLNAQIIKAVFGELCPAEVVTDPTAPEDFPGRVLVAAGWKPGFSTDTDAVFLAERFGAKTIINLSNIAKVYSADPKLDPDATPLDHISWEDFLAMSGTEWVPGKNCPFDPVASKKAADLALQVITAKGTDLTNTMAILRGEEFEGSIIG